jgi:FkbM family methyltransferase
VRWTLLGLWLGLWRRAGLRSTARTDNLVVAPLVSDAAMRALLEWQADWKTDAIARILGARPGDFIDVGANVGQTLLDFLSASVPSTYVGFEPNLVCSEHLSRLIASNRIANSRVIPAALGDRTGIATLYRGSDVDAGATLLGALRPGYPVETTEACVFRLDDLGEIVSQESISLIKIDVEGGELEALRGMTATIGRHRPWILCEVLDRDLRAESGPHEQRRVDLMKLIHDIGYSVFRIAHSDGGTTINDLEKIDAFPAQAWNDRSALACDYLFVPANEAAVARELLVR